MLPANKLSSSPALFRLSRPAPDIDHSLKAMPTLGHGDCAFHAVFGIWVAEEKMYICPEVADKRRQLAASILKHRADSTMSELIFFSLRELIMESSGGGDRIQSIRNQYHEWHAQFNLTRDGAWTLLEDQIQKFPDVLAYIKKGSNRSSLKLQFYECLQQDQEAMHLKIIDYPELLNVYETYTSILQSEFDWSQLKNPLILADYVEYVIKRPGISLLTSELGLIAHAFDITIVYHARAARELPAYDSGEYNPGKPTKVCVSFIKNALHYERLISAEDFQKIDLEQKQAVMQVSKTLSRDLELQQRALSQLDESTRKEIVCKLCDSLLCQPIVTCEENSKFDQPAEFLFHKACLESFFEGNVVDPEFRTSLNPEGMKTSIVEMAIDGVSTETVCSLSYLCGAEITRPVRASNGKIYQKESLLAYFKTAPRMLPDRTVIKNVYKPITERDFQHICNAAKAQDLAIPGEEKPLSSLEIAESFKKMILVNDDLHSILEDQKLVFSSTDAKDALKRLAVMVDSVGELKFGMQDKDLDMLQQEYWFMEKTQWSEYRLQRILAYSKLAIPYSTAGGSAAAGISAIAGAHGVTGVGLPVAITLGTIAGFLTLTRYFARKFRYSLQLAVESFMRGINEKDRSARDGHFAQVETLLQMELGLGEQGRSAVTRGLGYLDLSYDEYGFAYLVRATNAAMRTAEYHRRIAYDIFEMAYSYAKDRQIKGMALLGQIKLLSPIAENVTPYSCGEPIQPAEQMALLNSKILALNREFKEIPEQIVKMILSFSDNVLLFIKRSGSLENAKSLKFLVQFSDQLNQFLGLQELYLLRYFEPHGKVCEAIVPFLHGILTVLMKEHGRKLNEAVSRRMQTILRRLMVNISMDPDKFAQQPDQVARAYFLICWDLIRKYHFLESPNLTIRKLASDIKSHIVDYFERCINQGIVEDVDQLLRVMHDKELLVTPKGNVRASTQALLQEANQTLSGAESFDRIENLLSHIISTPEFAAHISSGNKTWLHKLATLAFQQELRERVPTAVRHVLSSRVSPYERNLEGNTAYFYLKNYDHYNIQAILPKDVLIGVGDQTNAMSDFLITAKQNPKTEHHFLLVTGPSGVGKRFTAKRLLNNLGYKVFIFKSAESGDKWHNALNSRVADTFTAALKEHLQTKMPVCIIFEAIHATFPNAAGTLEQGHVDVTTAVGPFDASLKSLTGHPVAVIGITNDIQLLHPTVRDLSVSPVHFTFPKLKDRMEFIDARFRFVTLKNKALLKKVAEATSGCSLRALSSYLDRVLKKLGEPHIGAEDTIFHDQFESLRVNWASDYADFKLVAPKLQKPQGAMFSGMVALTQATKDKLIQTLSFMQHPEEYLKVDPKCHFNYLLIGPAGTGKTRLAGAVAEQAQCVFISIECGSFGEGREAASKMRKLLQVAKTFEKAIIFLDEIHHLNPQQFTELQTFMDGFSQPEMGVTTTIWAATNYPSKIPAPTRNRFNLYELGLPNLAQRTEVYALYIKELIPDFAQNPQNHVPELSAHLARHSEGLSQRIIRNVVSKTAASRTTARLLNQPTELKAEHFMTALAETRIDSLAEQKLSELPPTTTLRQPAACPPVRLSDSLFAAFPGDNGGERIAINEEKASFEFIDKRQGGATPAPF